MDAIVERPDWLYAGLVLLVALIPLARFRALGAAGLGLVLLAAASDRVGGESSGTTFATVNEMLLGVGALVVVVAAAIAVTRIRSASQTELLPDQPRPPTPAAPLLLLSGLTLAFVALHLLLVELGMLLVLVAAIRDVLVTRKIPWLLVLLTGGGILGAALVIAGTILGPDGGTMATLREGPFSPAAERLLVMLFGAGTLVLAGVPPFHRAPWGTGLAPLAAIVMARITLTALPGGVLEWQPLAMLLLAGAVVSAALIRRWPALAVAAGLASLWSGVPSGVFAAEVLILWGWLLDMLGPGRMGWLPKLGERWGGLALLLPGLAALPVLEAMLGAQVVTSVVCVAGVIAASIREFLRRPEGAPPPLY